MAFENLMLALKHLPGQHNQMEHGRRGGKGGGAAKGSDLSYVHESLAKEFKSNGHKAGDFSSEFNIKGHVLPNAVEQLKKHGFSVEGAGMEGTTYLSSKGGLRAYVSYNKVKNTTNVRVDDSKRMMRFYRQRSPKKE